MLLLGAVASPHCGLMCGALSVQQARSSGALDARQAMLWTQAGRIGGYAAAGSIAGGLGQSFIHALPAPWFGEFVRTVGAVAVLILGMRMLLRTPQPALAHCHVPVPPGTVHWPIQARLLIQGSAWALIPCGLLYSVLLMSALSGSVGAGALLASAFAVGGSPALALIGWSGSRRTTGLSKRRLAGAWLTALGCVSLLVILLGGHAGLPAWCAANP
jgi:hypothetical protein